jgi:hypothetical protein
MRATLEVSALIAAFFLATWPVPGTGLDGTAARTATGSLYLRRTGRCRSAVFRHRLTGPCQLDRKGGRSMGITQWICVW